MVGHSRVLPYDIFACFQRGRYRYTIFIRGHCHYHVSVRLVLGSFLYSLGMRRIELCILRLSEFEHSSDNLRNHGMLRVNGSLGYSFIIAIVESSPRNSARSRDEACSKCRRALFAATFKQKRRQTYNASNKRQSNRNDNESNRSHAADAGRSTKSSTPQQRPA